MLSQEIHKILNQYMSKDTVGSKSIVCEGNLQRLLKNIEDDEQLARDFRSHPLKYLAKYDVEIDELYLDQLSAAGKSSVHHKVVSHIGAEHLRAAADQGDPEKTGSPEGDGNVHQHQDVNKDSALEAVKVLGWLTAAGMLIGVAAKYKGSAEKELTPQQKFDELVNASAQGQTLLNKANDNLDDLRDAYQFCGVDIDKVMKDLPDRLNDLQGQMNKLKEEYPDRDFEAKYKTLVSNDEVVHGNFGEADQIFWGDDAPWRTSETTAVSKVMSSKNNEDIQNALREYGQSVKSSVEELKLGGNNKGPDEGGEPAEPMKPSWDDPEAEYDEADIKNIFSNPEANKDAIANILTNFSKEEDGEATLTLPEGDRVLIKDLIEKDPNLNEAVLDGDATPEEYASIFTDLKNGNTESATTITNRIIQENKAQKQGQEPQGGDNGGDNNPEMDPNLPDNDPDGE